MYSERYIFKDISSNIYFQRYILKHYSERYILQYVSSTIHREYQRVQLSRNRFLWESSPVSWNSLHLGNPGISTKLQESLKIPRNLWDSLGWNPKKSSGNLSQKCHTNLQKHHRISWKPYDVIPASCLKCLQWRGLHPSSAYSFVWVWLLGSWSIVSFDQKTNILLVAVMDELADKVCHNQTIWH